jgi:SAM-dependent methyltransferase
MSESSGEPERMVWIRQVRSAMEVQEDGLSSEYDALWGEIEELHREFVEAFLSRLPPGGRVLDAACGTGKYFGMVLATGRSVLGADHSAGHLAVAGTRFPRVPTTKVDLQDLRYRGEFDGVMCVDAMEFVPPEEWPAVLEGFRRALRPGGRLYVTVELAAEDVVRTLNEEARRAGRPVVEGEVFYEEPDGYYHYHPGMDRVRAWLSGAGFVIEEDAEGPWDDDEEFAYHHVLARATPPATDDPP